MPPNCRSFPDRSRIHLYNRTRNSRESILLSNTRLCRNNTSQAIQPQFANYNRAKPDIRHRQVQLISNPFLKLERLKNRMHSKPNWFLLLVRFARKQSLQLSLLYRFFYSRLIKLTKPLQEHYKISNTIFSIICNDYQMK